MAIPRATARYQFGWLANVGTGVTGYNAQGVAQASGSASIVAYVANNANARYVVAGSGALANGGRNTFPLHPTDNIDMGLKKRFNFTERVSFDIGGRSSTTVEPRPIYRRLPQ